jgi:gluconokinase
MRRALQLPDSEALEAALAGMAPDAHGLTALPFLAGERCPGWRGDARAAFVGLSWDTEPLEIVRAGLEAVALRCALIHDLLRPAAAEPHRLIASGGALLASPAWMRMVADAVGRPLVASLEPEASSRGAALLALEGSGLVADADDLPLRVGAEYLPDPERHERYRAAGRRQAELYRRLLDPPLVDPLQLA